MSLSVGIVGLPNVGKSTLFNAIMGRQAALTAPYPFATVEPNVGVVDVPDERLVKLRDAMFPINQKSEVQPPLVYSSITFVDIAGLVKGAAQGHGLGNKFLSHIRDVDVILHVVRDFDDPDVPRHEDSKDPENDIKIVETELELKDLELKEKNPNYTDYLSKKPVIYAVNTSESSKELFFSEKNSSYNALSFNAKLEEEISRLPKNEQKEYLAAYGLTKSGLDRIIKQCYKLLGLISFLTAGEIEVRAWPVKKGSVAPQAAAVIHSDFEKLFIRAEIIPWEKMIEAGSWITAKEKGLVKTEGKDYIMQDGDVCNFLIGK